MSISVGILLLRGGLASTAVQPLDIFNSTGQLWNALSDEPCDPAFEVTTATVDGNPVITDRHLSLTPECSFEDLDQPDLIFVPAGGLELDTMVRDGYDIDSVIEQNAEVVDWLRHWSNQGSKIAAVCSGVALPAQAGLLDGKVATVHWGVAELYRKRFPAVDWKEEYLVADADDIFCGGGANAASDLSLYLVEKYCGRDVALRTARALIIEMPRTWQNSFTHFSLRANHNDEPVLKVQEWLQKHYSQDVRLDEIARQFGMSNRNFTRRFKEATGESPLNYLQGMRVAVAKRLLETSQKTIQEITELVGYTDLIFFRSLFKRRAGLSPNDYRLRFG